MRLDVRVALFLALLLFASVVLSAAAARRAVFRPLDDDLLRMAAHQAAQVAREVEAGADPDEVGARYGLVVDTVELPPGPPPAGLLAPRGHARFHRQLVRGDVVLVRPEDGGVAVPVQGGWVVVRPPLALGDARRRILGVQVVVAGCVLLGGLWVARTVTRPLSTAVEAMDRMGRGDLEHRLPEAGPQELRTAARSFNAMADRVAAMLQTEKELMAGLSHELRTPLARLRLETELLRDAGDVPEARLAGMEADLEELDDLVGGLLDLSRLDLGQAVPRREPLALDLVVHRAIDRARVRRDRVRVGGQGATVHVDPTLAGRVIVNVLQNAARYAPADSPIEVVLDATRVTVADRGPGASEEDLARFGEPFYRGRETARHTAGLGLGLMLARRVLHLHGGHLQVGNRDGGGLEVTLDFGGPPPDPTWRATST